MGFTRIFPKRAKKQYLVTCHLVYKGKEVAKELVTVVATSRREAIKDVKENMVLTPRKAHVYKK